MSPFRAILLQSPGRKPWVSCYNTFVEPPKGRHNPTINTRAESAAPEGAQSTSIRVYPGFHFGLCPHYTLGFAGVPCLKALGYCVLSPQNLELISISKSKYKYKTIRC